MVIQRSQVRIVAMNQTGSWGVDLQRMQSAVVVNCSGPPSFMYSIATPFVPNGQH